MQTERKIHVSDGWTLFLDRDGVINKDYGYVYSLKNFVWLKNVKKAIKYE